MKTKKTISLALLMILAAFSPLLAAEGMPTKVIIERERL